MTEETRFFNRKAHLIGFSDLTEVMQELLDDTSLEIERDYPVLSMYSEGNDCGYNETDIMQRVADYLGVEIIACFKFDDLEEVYFIESN